MERYPKRIVFVLDCESGEGSINISCGGSIPVDQREMTGIVAGECEARRHRVEDHESIFDGKKGRRG